MALLARAMLSGATSCLSLAFGMVISDVFYLILACLGLAVVAEQWSGFFTVIRLVGACYLLYLGWKMWTAPIDTKLKETSHGDGYTISKGLLQGFLISASNPKVIIFYIAFLPTILDIKSLTHSDILLASCLAVIALMLGLMLIAVSASSARRFFTSAKAVKALNRTAGGVMFGAGSFLVLHS